MLERRTLASQTQWRALAALLCLALGCPSADTSDLGAAVEEGKTISVEYRLTLEDGTEFQNNLGGEPMTFVHGTGQIVPGLDAAMIGMRAGQSKTITVAPELGYGKVDPEAFHKVPVSELPDPTSQVGARIVAYDEEGEMQIFYLDRLEGDKAILDANHPLAGKQLTFDFKILSVE